LIEIERSLYYVRRNNTVYIDFTFELSFGELETEIFAKVLLRPFEQYETEPVTSFFTHGEVDGSRAARADTHNRVSRKNIITSSANRPSRSNPIRSVSHAEYPSEGIIFKIDSNLTALTLAFSSSSFATECDPDRAHGSHGKVTRS